MVKLNLRKVKFPCKKKEDFVNESVDFTQFSVVIAKNVYIRRHLYNIRQN